MITEGWKDRYLWICHEAGITEDNFMVPDEQDLIRHPSSVAQIKKTVHEQFTLIGKRCNMIVREIERTQRELLDKVSEHKDNANIFCAAHEAPSDDGVPMPSFSRITHQEIRGASAVDTQEITKVEHDLTKMRVLINQRCQAQRRIETKCNAIAAAMKRVSALKYQQHGSGQHALALPPASPTYPNTNAEFPGRTVDSGAKLLT